jgi:RNA polymerase sigma-70 factor, ECF subfamily
MDRITAADTWRAHRAHLVNLAYQMLRDVGSAEDMVQEAFLRFSAAPPGEIDDERAWLTVVTGRLCLDFLRSARVRRESTGWADDGTDRAAPLFSRSDADPADRVTLDDAVSRALTEVLNRLSPGERVAFILHDLFAVPFETIAEMTGRPTAGCRQLARRARAKLARGDLDAEIGAGAVHQEVVDRFITACAGGDLHALAAVLDPSVWGVGTVLADPAPARQVNHGPTDVATNLMRYVGTGATLVSVPGSRPTLLAFADRRLFAVITLTVRDGRVLTIEATADPAARFGKTPTDS